MTTAAPRTGLPARDTGAGVLGGAALATVLTALALVVLGALLEGSPAALGALVGAGLALGVLSFGSFTINTVAGLMPAASLMFAVLTYTLQVVVMGVVFAALTGSGLLEETLDRQWLAGAVIAATVAWMVGQVVLATRRRIPVYDLPTGGER